MNDNYDNDEDDGYDDEDYYNYDGNDQYDPYKFYFKFDINPNSSLSSWITDLINFPFVSFPVNSYIPNTGDGTKNPFLYLGNNYHNQPIWKNPYLVRDQINILYKNHISQHSIHFLKQPTYYKGMFDILN
ncbi:MAG: hypothetical protein EBS93_07010 [Chitinophagia bacterium]|nr:hypothetical protein [Chitinophagia bacterium]NCA30448.1 hypothetical protein [Chitinophagia bacterium]